MSPAERVVSQQHDIAAPLWETGELGQSEDHVRVATAAEMAELDDALGLQMISIRLQKGLVSALKEVE